MLISANGVRTKNTKQIDYLFQCQRKKWYIHELCYESGTLTIHDFIAVYHIRDKRRHEFENVSFEILNYLVVFNKGNSSSMLSGFCSMSYFRPEFPTLDVMNDYDIEVFGFNICQNSNCNAAIEFNESNNYQLSRF